MGWLRRLFGARSDATELPPQWQEPDEPARPTRSVILRNGLAPPCVELGWDGIDDWRRWRPYPRNAIRGESRYQDAIVAICGPPCPDGYLLPVPVEFVREPANPYDTNALAARVNGAHVGYLAREVAADVAPVLDAAGVEGFTVCGVLRGGDLDRPMIGCHVWLDRRLTDGPAIDSAAVLTPVRRWRAGSR